MANAHLDAVFDNMKRARYIQDRLNHLSDCFDAVGNSKMADELSFIAKDVYDAARIILDTHGENLNQELKRSQESTGNILKALLNVATKDRNPDNA